MRSDNQQRGNTRTYLNKPCSLEANAIKKWKKSGRCFHRTWSAIVGYAVPVQTELAPTNAAYSFALPAPALLKRSCSLKIQKNKKEKNKKLQLGDAN